MLKGIAKAGGEGTPEDHYGVVVALSNLSKAISCEQSESGLTAAAEAAAALLHVPMVLVFVGEGDALSTGGHVGVAEDGPLAKAAAAVGSEAMAMTSPCVHSDLASETADSAKKLAAAGAASAVCMPMRVGESNLGVIVAMTTEPRTFSPSDLELLHVVANQAALAAWKSGPEVKEKRTKRQDDLFQLAQRKIQELSLLNRVSQAVNSTLDLDAVLDIALEQAMTAVGADAGSLMLINEDNNRLEIVASRGIDKKWTESTSQEIGASVAGWVAEHGESVLVTRARDDKRFKMSAFRDEISSAASVPLHTKNGVIGVLNVNTVQPDKHFDERDLQVLGTVANQMAVAIENARLYSRVNRRTRQLDSLLRISKAVASTLNLDDVLRHLADEISRLFQFDVVVLLLLDELSGRLRFGYGTGLRTRRKYPYFDLAAPIARRVKETGRRIIVPDISSARSLRTDISDAEGLKTAVCIPLKNQGNLVGVAAGFAREVRRLPQSQKDIIKPLGDLAGVAIRNARVYRQKYRIASLLQHRLIPSTIPDVQQLDIGYKFLPAREVGGDYFDFVDAGPDKLGIIVADVAGSDVDAAEYATMGKYVLRSYAREYGSPAKVLSRANDLICQDTRAEMFISVFYGVVDLRAMKLTYACAGCEPPLVCRAGKDECSQLAADGILLGIKSGSHYAERQVQLAKGDVLAVYTDGLPEAEFERKRFGSDGVAAIVTANMHLQAQEIADRIHDALIEFVHGRVTDDVAMLIFKVR